MTTRRRGAAVVGRVLAVVSLALVAATGRATDADFDFAFGTDGVLTLLHPVTSEPLVVGTLEPYGAGAVAAVGFTGGSGLALLDADGVIDGTFGTSGVADFPAGALVRDVLVLADATILVAGGSSGELSLTRFTATGALHPTFGTGGVVETDLGFTSTVLAVAQQPDGKIVALAADTGVSGKDIVLARYELDGSLDATFGTGGVVEAPADFGVNARDVDVQQDGRIVVVADTEAGDDLLLARFDTDGSYDATFGTGGIVKESGVDADQERLALQPDDRAVVFAKDLNGDQADDSVLLRYDDGVLDPTFGTGGKLESGLLWTAVSFRMLPGGGFLLSGVPAGFNLKRFGFEGDARGTAIERYDADGAVDVAFGPCAAAVFLTEAQGFVPLQDGRLLGVADGSLVRIGTASPAPVCAEAASGKAVVKYIPARTDLTDLVVWKWKNAAVVQKSDFGDPVSDTAFVMCMLQDGGPTPGAFRVAGGAAGGSCTFVNGPKPCWKELKRGFQFGDLAGSVRFKLLAGDAGRAKILVKDKTSQYAGTPPFGLPVRVRMLRVDGQGCWQATFSEAKINVEGDYLQYSGPPPLGKFVARSD